MKLPHRGATLEDAGTNRLSGFDPVSTLGGRR
jgi:hypothetical protein